MWCHGEATHFLREGTGNPTEKPGNEGSKAQHRTVWYLVALVCRLGVSKAAKRVFIYRVLNVNIASDSEN